MEPTEKMPHTQLQIFGLHVWRTRDKKRVLRLIRNTIFMVSDFLFPSPKHVSGDLLQRHLVRLQAPERKKSPVFHAWTDTSAKETNCSPARGKRIEKIRQRGGWKAWALARGHWKAWLDSSYLFGMPLRELLIGEREPQQQETLGCTGAGVVLGSPSQELCSREAMALYRNLHAPR
jgi:hypothetical protein